MRAFGRKNARYSEIMPLALTLDAYDLPGFVKVARDFGAREFAYVVTPNIDHVIRYCDDPAFRLTYADATYVLLDSRLLARILRLTTRLDPPVCTGSDLVAALFAEVIAPEDPIVLIGGTADQVSALRRKYGLLNLQHYNPPMGFIADPAQVDACAQFVERHSPFRFCLLAVGSPQQELLAQRLRQRGSARGLALCIGAAVNFITGDERRAPRWMQAMALEWAYRLANNPRRLARRYLVRGPRILRLLGRVDFRLRPPNSTGTGGREVA